VTSRHDLSSAAYAVDIEIFIEIFEHSDENLLRTGGTEDGTVAGTEAGTEAARPTDDPLLLIDKWLVFDRCDII